MTFRISAKKILLTFPQHSGSKEELLEHLRSYGTLKQYVICRELHQDGHPHLHAAVEYASKIYTTNPAYFDFQYKHGNYQTVKKWSAAVEYVKKGDDVIEEITSSIVLDWGGIFEQATCEEEFLSLVLQYKPRDYALNLERLEYVARKRFKPAEPEYVPVFSAFNIPDILEAWLCGSLQRPFWSGRFTGLFLIGPTRTGKSEWARSLGLHTYWQSMFALDEYRGGICIFDDVKWDHVPAKKCFFGGQRNPFMVSDKYRKKTRLSLEAPCIFICNPEDSPFMNMAPEEFSYYESNNVIVRINSALF